MILKLFVTFRTYCNESIKTNSSRTKHFEWKSWNRERCTWLEPFKTARELSRNVYRTRLIVVIPSGGIVITSIVWSAASCCRLPTSSVTRLRIPSGSPCLPATASISLPAAGSSRLPATASGCSLPGQQLQVLLQQHGQRLHSRVLQTRPQCRSRLPEGATTTPRQGCTRAWAWGLWREYHFHFALFILEVSQL